MTRTRTKPTDKNTLLITVIGLPILILFFGSSTQLTCERLERNYVTCQFDNQYLFGFLSDSSPPFRLSTFQVKTKEIIRRDSEGTSYKEINYEAYITPKEGEDIFFKDYGSNDYKAREDEGKIIELGINTGASVVTLHGSSFWIKIQYLGRIIYVFIWFVPGVLTLFYRLFKGGKN